MGVEGGEEFGGNGVEGVSQFIEKEVEGGSWNKDLEEVTLG